MSELIDRQALLSKRGELAYCEVCPVWSLIKDAPTVAASPWHRVEEPPKEEGKYLVSDGRGNYFVAWWGPRLGWCYDPKFFCYWMPIEPPTGTERSET